MSNGASPKPHRAAKANPWATRKVRRSAFRSGEPQTLEGRARKKIQICLLYRMGCVLTYAEMEEVIKVLPPKWLEKECK